ncbi:hypothetical protein L9F63_022643, partial [Diploptera punctata]
DIGRNMGRNVKLLLDVINCRYPYVEPAVRFAVSNTLVCDDMDVATYLAYEYEAPQRHDVVTLDGTHIKKNGIVSVGKRSLSRTARMLSAVMLGCFPKLRMEPSQKFR